MYLLNNSLKLDKNPFYKYQIYPELRLALHLVRGANFKNIVEGVLDSGTDLYNCVYLSWWPMKARQYIIVLFRGVPGNFLPENDSCYPVSSQEGAESW